MLIGCSERIAKTAVFPFYGTAWDMDLCKANIGQRGLLPEGMH
jgi:hypothetical protein